jgi:hypothetical protein
MKATCVGRRPDRKIADRKIADRKMADRKMKPICLAHHDPD